MSYYIKRTKTKKNDKSLPLFDKAGVTIKKKPNQTENLTVAIQTKCARQNSIYGLRGL